MKLPVCEIEEKIRGAMSVAGGRLLLKAPTGSGKSTMVPGMVKDEVRGRVLVVQPRRLAARLLAEYVAEMRGVRLGGGVGYAVRFENRSGPETEILFLTDGVLQRMLLEDPDLTGVGAVIFDEFHERRLASDLCLGRVLDLQEGGRGDLRVVVMSATLETGGLAEFLAPCELVEAGGRLFPVEIEHRGEGLVTKSGAGGRREELWDRVGAAVKREAESLGAGDRILVFLPGGFEIRRTAQVLEGMGAMRGWEVHSLYSAMNPESQRAAIRLDGSKKVILATNVAETSVTIEGVRVVVDSGLARQSKYDFGRGFDSLRVVKISRASAEQRAGRAGRLGPGKCVRLWSESDHRGRAEFEVPEVGRVDLAEAVMFLKKLGVREVGEFRWLDVPDEVGLREAEGLLVGLGAVDEWGGLTKRGEEMSKLPMHPRLGAMVEAGAECLGEVLFVAAAVQGEGIFLKGDRGKKWGDFLEGEVGWRNDFAGEWLAVQAARAARFRAAECQELGVMGRAAREAWEGFLQGVRMMEGRGRRVKEPDFRQRGEECARAILVGFGDRLAVRRDRGSAVCEVVGARRGKLHPKSVVKEAPLFLATEMMEVEGRERSVLLSRGVEIEEGWLGAEEVTEWEGVEYDEDLRRVVGVRRRMFRGLVLEEKRGGEVDGDLAGEVLARKVLAGELKLKNWDAKVERWIARLVFLSETMPEFEFPGFEEGDREVVIGQMCAGAVSFKEVRDRDPWPVLREWLSDPQRQAMEVYAPEKVNLGNGVSAWVGYRLGESPWIAEKVQRLYGVKETPTIAGGHRLVVQILAPNERPWQVTSDLAGFWERGFAQMRKDLAGRYPKHNWEGA